MEDTNYKKGCYMYGIHNNLMEMSKLNMSFLRVIIANIILLSLITFSFSNLVNGEITLGSMADVNSLTIQKGEIGRFKISFFNLGNDPLKVEFSTEYPNELRVELDPKKLTLYPGTATSSPSECSGSEECEWFILNDGKSYVRVHPVYIYVKIPSEISRNFYRIKINAIASNINDNSKNKEGIKQSLAQVREFTLSAYVPGKTTGKEIEYGYEEEKESNLSLKDIYQEMLRNRSKKTTLKEGILPASQDEGYEAEDMTDKIKISQKEEEDQGLFGITRDAEGRTKINLPTGKIVMSKEQTETAIDLGIITLGISVLSLIIRLLK